MQKIMLSVSLLSLMIACSTSKPATKETTSVPAGPNIEKVKKDSPDYTVAMYNEGKTLYGQKCTMCHDLPNPTYKSAAEWIPVIDKMVYMANQEMENISKTQQDLIVKYLKVETN
jgi:cytochrome c5